MAVKKILCVCKGNTCRSPMLAEVLKREFQTYTKDFEVESAGILKEAAGQSAASEWLKLQSETSIDLSNHYSRWIGEIGALDSFHRFVCAEPAVVEEIKKLGVPEEKIILANAPEGIPNPWKQGLEAYRACYSVICQAVYNLTHWF